MKTTFVFLAFVSLFAFGQTPKNLPVFRLGMTEAQMKARFGTPKLEPKGALVWNVYSRVVHGREYEIMAILEPDENGSRLHPNMIVTEFRVEADKPTPVRTLIADTPETAAMCGPACVVYDGSEFGLGSQITLRRPQDLVEAGFSYFDLSAKKRHEVHSLDDNATSICFSRYDPNLRTGDTLNKIGYWPPSGNQSPENAE